MKVEFKSAQKLAGRIYAAGKQEISDALVKHPHLKKLIFSGEVVKIPRDNMAIEALANRNQKAFDQSQAMKKAAELRALSEPKAAPAPAMPDPMTSAAAPVTAQAKKSSKGV